MGCRIIKFDTGTGTAHTNSVTETALCEYQFPAGALQIGNKYRFRAAVHTTAQNSTDTLTLYVRFGTSATPASNTAIATSSAVDQETDDMAVIWGEIDVQSATRYVFEIHGSDADGSNEATWCTWAAFTATVETAYYLQISGDWSVASASNSVRSEAFSIEEITQG